MKVFQVGYEITQPGGTHKEHLFCVASNIDVVWEQYRVHPELDEYTKYRVIFINEHVPLDVLLPLDTRDVIEE